LTEPKPLPGITNDLESAVTYFRPVLQRLGIRQEAAIGVPVFLAAFPHLWNLANIDKWVGVSGTEPKVIDLCKVCKILNITMEWVVDGEEGAGYIRQWVRENGGVWEPPGRIADIVQGLLLLTDEELVPIRGAVFALTGDL
jgi:hypothetical protein